MSDETCTHHWTVTSQCPFCQQKQIDRMTIALAQISLMEYESTSSASEKVHAAAKIARAAMPGPKK